MYTAWAAYGPRINSAPQKVRPMQICKDSALQRARPMQVCIDSVLQSWTNANMEHTLLPRERDQCKYLYIYIYICIHARIFVRASRALDSHILLHDLGTGSIVQSPDPRHTKNCIWNLCIPPFSSNYLPTIHKMTITNKQI